MKYYKFAVGRVKRKVVPVPKILFTKILPPFISISSLHKINPNPEPFSFAVPGVDCLSSNLNNFFNTSVYKPI